MRKLFALFALSAMILALFFGCTKEREISGPGDDMTCLGCHSDEEMLQDLTADSSRWTPPASGREDG